MGMVHWTGPFLEKIEFWCAWLKKTWYVGVPLPPQNVRAGWSRKGRCVGLRRGVGGEAAGGGGGGGGGGQEKSSVHLEALVRGLDGEEATWSGCRSVGRPRTCKEGIGAAFVDAEERGLLVKSGHAGSVGLKTRPP